MQRGWDRDWGEKRREGGGGGLRERVGGGGGGGGFEIGSRERRERGGDRTEERGR